MKEGQKMGSTGGPKGEKVRNGGEIFRNRNALKVYILVLN